MCKQTSLNLSGGLIIFVYTKTKHKMKAITETAVRLVVSNKVKSDGISKKKHVQQWIFFPLHKNEPSCFHYFRNVLTINIIT